MIAAIPLKVRITLFVYVRLSICFQLAHSALALRKFRIVRNCREFQDLVDLVYDRSKADAGKYFERLKALTARGRLWITDLKVSHSHDSSVDGKGAIEWIRLSVEIIFPSRD